MQICSSAVHWGSEFAVVNRSHILGVKTNFFWFVEKFLKCKLETTAVAFAWKMTITMYFI